MSVIPLALDALFADPNLSVTAVYTASGASPVAVRVMVRQPDRVLGFGEARLHAEATLIDVRTQEVPTLSRGDQFEIAGEVFLVQGEPVRDSGQLIWTAECVAP